MHPASTDVTSVAARWRIFLVTLAILLGLTNLLELGATFQPDYWDKVGTTGIQENRENGKMRVVAVHADQNPDVAAIRPGDLLSVVSRDSSHALLPPGVDFRRLHPRDESVLLRVERGSESFQVATHFRAPPGRYGKVYVYGQAIVDLVFAIAGGLLAWRRPGDRAIRALALAMICWSSSQPVTSGAQLSTVLWVLNQATARVWYEVLLVYWAVHLCPPGQGGVPAWLRRAWPLWAAASIAIGAAYRYGLFFPSPLPSNVFAALDYFNRFAAYVLTTVVLARSVMAVRGEQRTRLSWGLFIFGVNFAIFPLRIITLWMHGTTQEAGFLAIDYVFQLALPLGLLYATLRHRLLDFGFAVNRALVFTFVSSFLLVLFGVTEFAVDKLLHFEGREKNVIFDALVALGVILSFHRIQHTIKHRVDHTFFHHWYEAAARLRHFLDRSAHITDGRVLQDRFVAEIVNYCGASGAALYEADGAGRLNLCRGVLTDAPATFGVDDELVVDMRHSAAPARLAPRHGALPASWAFAMSLRGQLSGALLLGPAVAGRDYRPDEIDLLAEAVRRLAVNLEFLRVIELRQCCAALAHEVQALRTMVPKQDVATAA
jgi:hypothetical protein